MNTLNDEFQNTILQSILDMLEIIYEPPKNLVTGKLIFSEEYIKKDIGIELKTKNYIGNNKLKSYNDDNYDINIHYLEKCMNFIFYEQQKNTDKITLTFFYIFNLNKNRCTVLVLGTPNLNVGIYFYNYEIDKTIINVENTSDEKIISLRNNFLTNFQAISNIAYKLN